MCKFNRHVQSACWVEHILSSKGSGLLACYTFFSWPSVGALVIKDTVSWALVSTSG